ncbi:Transcription elongation complex subunit Cdc68 [Spraguea lophii 42_110]|uniref:FACT complex subunit n=1 Tax=Spraguea lophii (strain 42_110) TaxID=1358809 RepID=S7WAW8_SPRLO|nr:Transcription elongation complex subunit Cdc68 [Spraguea lophii 42_110]
MLNIKLNSENFISRVTKIRSHLTDLPLLLILGKTIDVEIFGSNSAFFLYLLEYEFPETLLLINKNNIYAVTTPKKASLLEQLQKDCDMKILVRRKDRLNTEEIIRELVKVFGTKVQVVDRKNLKGDYVDDMARPFEWVEIDGSKFFREKEEGEKEYVRKSIRCNNYFGSELRKILFDDERFTHGQIKAKIEELLDTDSPDFPETIAKVEFGATPEVKSIVYGNDEELEELFLQYNVINTKLVVKYKGYNSIIARTYLVNQDEENNEILRNLFELRNLIVEEVKNLNLSELKQKVERFTKEKVLKIKDNYIHSIGLLSTESMDELDKDMCIVIDLNEESGIRIADTLIVSDPKVEDGPGDFILEMEKKRRGMQREVRRVKELEKNIERNEHQKELMSNIIEEMLKYYSENSDEVKEEKKEEEFYAYKKENLLLRGNKIMVDKKNHCVNIPVYGQMVPFHIFYIKNISRNEEDVHSFLRFNFKDTKGAFLKSLTYKGNTTSINFLFQEINDMKKNFLQRLEEKSYAKDQVEQEELVESRGSRIVLSEASLRTDVRLGGRKVKPSNLELHENGFRYFLENEKIDILFSNIKHFIFQECRDKRAIIHFKLIAPLFLNKKTFDIQFYKEIDKKEFHDTARSGRNEEYMEKILEEEEEMNRDELNLEFKRFIAKIEEKSNLRAETPFPEKGFYAVPYKENVFIQSTNELLISITETPFLVVTLSEIEVVNFERVNFSVRSFDLAIIYKDKTHILIQSVELSKIYFLKDFFDSKNVCYIETTVNIQWNNLIKSILHDPIGFYEAGGWSELQPVRDDEEDEESAASLDTTESEDDEEYEISDVSEEFAGEEEPTEEELEEYSEDEYNEEYEEERKRLRREY